MNPVFEAPRISTRVVFLSSYQNLRASSLYSKDSGAGPYLVLITQHYPALSLPSMQHTHKKVSQIRFQEVNELLAISHDRNQ